MDDEFDIWQQESGHAKVLKQHNTSKRDGGLRCNGFEEFPKLLYRAQKHPLSAKFYVALSEDEISLDRTRVIVDAQQFNRSCQLLVETPEAEEKALRAGWRNSQAEAMEYHEQEILRLATAAAHRNYEDQGRSEPAKLEIAAAEADTPAQIGEIPQKPVDRFAKARAAKAAKKAASAE